MKNAWMIYSNMDIEKNMEYFNMNRNAAMEYGVNLKLMILEDFSYGVRDGELYLDYLGERVLVNKEEVLFAIGRMRNYLFTRHLELMGVDVYNNSFVSMTCNDKAKTYQFLAGKGIKMIDTTFLDYNSLSYKNIRYKNDTTLCYSNNNKNNNYSVNGRNTNNDLVIKTCDGHGGSEVFKVSDYPFEDIYKDVVVQPFVKGKNQDLRVYVLNGRIVAAVIRTGKNSFKSNFSLGGDVKLYNLNEREKEVVYKIIKAFDDNCYKKDNCNDGLDVFDNSNISKNKNGLFYVGIDFIINDNGELLFNEIEDVVGSRMLYNTSDIDIVKEYMKTLLGNRY